uniref:Uncharacterized protein n=1 Tax=Arundo donax TaxID=35708 RepID=A0A0A9AS33_ARUDO
MHMLLPPMATCVSSGIVSVLGELTQVNCCGFCSLPFWKCVGLGTGMTHGDATARGM